MNTPFFSIIIPFLNVEEYLGACIQSLLDQTFPDFEAILIDDGSMDGSLEVYESMVGADSRFKLIQHPVNLGEATGKNEGIDAAQGEYLMFVDSDDFISAETLQLIYANIKEHDPDIVVFGGDTFPSTSWATDELKTTDAVITDTVYALFDVKGSRPFAANKAYRRTLVKEHGCYFKTDIRVGLDHVFQFETFPFASKVSYLSDSLYHYRQWDGSVMGGMATDQSKKLLAHVKFIEIIIKSWDAKGLLAIQDNRIRLTNWTISYLFDDMMKHMDGRMIDAFQTMLEWFDNGPLSEDDLQGICKRAYLCIRNMVRSGGGTNEDSPFVTIVLPVSHAQADLTEILFALRRQMETSIEVLMIDEGVDAAASEAARMFASYDARFKLIPAKHAGMAAALNQGLDEAHGDYIIFLDSDNFFDIEMIERMASKAQEAHADVCVVLARGENASHTHLYRMPWTCDSRFAPMDRPFAPGEIKGSILRFTTPDTWNKLFRTDLLRSEAIAFSPDDDTHALSLTIPALLSARTIIALDVPSLNHRFESEDPREASEHCDPFVSFQSLYALQEDLKERGLLQRFGPAFRAFALDRCLEALHAQNDSVIFSEFYAFLQQDGFEAFELPAAGLEKPLRRASENASRMRSILENPVDAYQRRWAQPHHRRLAPCDRPTSFGERLIGKAHGAVRRTKRFLAQRKFH